jgi:hypothetical protein
MTYETFARQVECHNLIPKQCSYYHWQILGGTRAKIVNVWPNGKGGFKFQPGSGKAIRGNIEAAIAAAGPVEAKGDPGVLAPWEQEKAGSPERVGLIRWLWRLLW